VKKHTFRLLDDKISKNGFFGNYETKLRVLCPDVRDNADLLCFNIILSSKWRNLFHSFSKIQMLIRIFWSRWGPTSNSRGPKKIIFS
jgi:hypothetical protein